MSFLDLSYPDVVLEDDIKTITRVSESGKCLSYLTNPLEVSQKLVFRVNRVDSDPVIHVINEEEMHGLKVGLTDCDRTSLVNHPYHLFDACQQDFDCGGKSITILIREPLAEGDEITLERRPGGIFRVRVNARTVFHVQDTTDSVFCFSSPALTPFVMLSGCVESLSISRLEGNSNAEVVGERVAGNWGTCVICMEKEADHMAVPCNHAAFCSSDAAGQMRSSGSKTCPICMQPVSSYVRIYIC